MATRVNRANTVDDASGTRPVVHDHKRIAVGYTIGLTKIAVPGPGLDHVDVAFGRGELTALVAPPRSGTSLLLECLTGREAPTAGRIFMDGVEITGLGHQRLHRFRRDNIGYVRSWPAPAGAGTVGRALCAAAETLGRPLDPSWTDGVVQATGLTGRGSDHLDALGPADRLRVAVAMALLGRPQLLLVDRIAPDCDRDLFCVLRTVVDRLGRAAVAVTSDPVAAAGADRAVLMSPGAIAGGIVDPDADSVRTALRLLRPSPPYPAAS